MAPIALLAVRALQILFAAVVLGLSINVDKFWSNLEAECKAAGKGCNTNDYPFNLAHTVFRYGAFVGAFGLIDAFVGIAAAFVSSLMWLIPLVVDGLAAVFFLAGGCRLAVLMAGVTSCSDASKNGYGTVCHQMQADAAFMFLGFLTCLAAMVLVFLNKRREGKGLSSV